MTPSTPASQSHPALSLLKQSHPASTASQIQQDQVRHRPLLLRPSSPDPSSASNKRTARRLARQQRALTARRAEAKRKKAGRASLTARPRPLSAREKRALGVHELGPRERKWSVFVGLHALWCAYMREVLGVVDGGGPAGRGAPGGAQAGSGPRKLTADGAGPLLASADFHGALLRVVRSRCVSRVGVEGIVVRDTKFTFVLVTREDAVKTVPKEGTVFRFEVPVAGSCVDEVAGEATLPASDGASKGNGGMPTNARPFVFEIHGEQFRVSAPDRANKKFKQHIDPGL